MNIPLGIQLYIAPQPEVQPTPGILPDSRSFSLTAAATEFPIRLQVCVVTDGDLFTMGLFSCL